MEDFDAGNSASEVEAFQNHLDQIVAKVDQLDGRVSGVEQFYDDMSKMQLNAPKFSSQFRNRNQRIGSKKQQVASERQASAADKMQELMVQFANILHQISKHRWAWPFLQPVDVKGLSLDDYHEIIDKPMDFATIKARMGAKDGSGYKNVREIYADVRLVFENAKKYNDEKSNIYTMAKNLSARFEESWRQLLPKVIDEERRREQEKAEAQLNLQLSREVEHAKMARDIINELSEVEANLEELKEMVLQKCRKLSVFDKFQLMEDFCQLPLEEMMKVLKIVGWSNPEFSCGVEHIELDLSPENDSAAWSLKFLVKNALEEQMKNSVTELDSNFNCCSGSNKDADYNPPKNKNMDCRASTKKMRQQICSVIANSAKKRCKGPS